MFLFSVSRSTPRSTLFPYTTLFRSSSNNGESRRSLSELAGGASPAPTLGFIEKCRVDRKSTRLNSSHQISSYAVFCLKKKKPNALIHHHLFRRTDACDQPDNRVRSP